MIPESFLDQLKYASPIEEVIASYVVLKRQGRTMKGLCPFHSEKTPSFTVYPENNSYYCFGCGNGGDVITFIRNIEHLEYIEALKLLAGRAGMTVPESGVDDRAARLKARVLELNRSTAHFFHRCLRDTAGQQALAYLQGRGLRGKTITRFGLGYAPDRWDALREHLKSEGFSQEEMLAAAVVRERERGGVYDAFRNRVMFPIIDLRGNVIGFGGRALGEGPKYLNSSDTPVFKKSRHLYALNFAKSSKREILILAEGYMDVIAIHQAGFDNAVATLGTALTPEQARLASQYTRRVAIAYDSDDAGQAATRRAINLLGETDIAVSVLEIQDAKDPDEYIKRYGAARFENLLAGGKGAIDFEVDRLRAGFDLGDTEGKAAFLQEFCKLMAGISNELQRDVYISAIARELDVGKEPLVATVRSLRKTRKNAATRKSAHNLRVYAQDKLGRRPADRQGTLSGFVAEEKLLTLLLKYPDSYNTVKTCLTPEDFVSEKHRELYAVLVEQLEKNKTPELIHFSSRLSPPQMAQLSQLMAAGASIPFYPEQAKEYCQAILAQKQEKTSDEIRDMAPEDIQDWLKTKRRK